MKSTFWFLLLFVLFILETYLALSAKVISIIAANSLPESNDIIKFEKDKLSAEFRPATALQRVKKTNASSKIINDQTHSKLTIFNQGLNLKPIIGILSQDVPQVENDVQSATPGPAPLSYLAASYVKFIESAGARVVPILTNQNETYYRNMVHSLNGFLFPGGGADVTTNGSFGRAGKMIYDLSLKAAEEGHPVPLFGTCLGFEMLGLLTAGRNPLSNCSAQDRADPLYFSEGYENSRLFAEMSAELKENLSTMNITANFHRKCITKQKFYDLGMNESLVALSTNFDDSGTEYISTFEHRRHPIYATQWHPEKPAFEWTGLKHHKNIPHEFEAIQAGQYIANFYVNEARKNANKFASKEEEERSLIYNYNPTFMTGKNRSVFEQLYFFK